MAFPHIARRIHEGAVPDALAFASEYRSEDLDRLEEWLVTRGLADAGLIAEHAARARAVRDLDCNHSLIHGDLQAEHVLVDSGGVSGVIDWSDAGLGDPHYDLAVLTVGHAEHLDAVVDGYGTFVDRDRISGYWSWRRLGSVRWMIEHGFDASGDLEALRWTSDPQ